MPSPDFLDRFLSSVQMNALVDGAAHGRVGQLIEPIFRLSSLKITHHAPFFRLPMYKVFESSQSSCLDALVSKAICPMSKSRPDVPFHNNGIACGKVFRVMIGLFYLEDLAFSEFKDPFIA